jgi:hypothetical protein
MANFYENNVAETKATFAKTVSKKNNKPKGYYCKKCSVERYKKEYDPTYYQNNKEKSKEKYSRLMSSKVWRPIEETSICTTPGD